MAPSAARVIATVVAEVCDMDSSSTSLHDIQERFDCVLAQLKRVLTGSPDAETVSALDRAIEAGARKLTALGTRLAAVCQARLLYVLMNPPIEQALASQLAAPEPLLAWLSAASSTTLALRDRGLSSMLALCFANLVNIINDEELLGPHALALQRDIGLQRSLVQVLIPALHAAAVAMQLPPDRRPCNVSWHTIMRVVDALMSAALDEQFKEQLASTAGISTIAQRVMQSTCRLLAAAPASCPDELTSSNFAALWHNLAALLGLTCSIQQQQQQQRGTSVPDAQRQKAVRLLLQALSRLPTALQVAADCQQDVAGCPLAKDALDMWRMLLSMMGQLRVQEPGLSADDRIAAANGVCAYHTIDSPADVPAWCSAGKALLQALPQVATVAALAQQYQAAEQQPDMEQQLAGEQPDAAIVPTTRLGSLISITASSIVDEVVIYCSTLANGGPWSAAACAAAGEALWQLHTTLCHCIHWIAAGSLATAAMPVRVLSFVLNAAVCVRAATPAAANETATGGARHLLAMSVAQAEAVLAAASLQPAPADEEVVEALLIAIRHGPAALAGSPPVQQALQRLAERLGTADEGSAAAASLHAAPLQHEPQPGDGLQLAQVAATRSCAFLHCANLAGEGGPASGQGAGSRRCSKCLVAWYCGTACSHADWRAGHRRVCRALGAARLAEQESAGVEV
ncbi:hypothetical protein D9Q98_003692 [Chlorella vulgaris]|uniref:MYND-type domain-containing protein n=1 Tax=Chlorella vulgaris TaxID=3077 RepID=A0A9D4TTE4_CHLVU|nr:hypothetical protein D9Q98_003692 [Chlorella vulgaris]